MTKNNNSRWIRYDKINDAFIQSKKINAEIKKSKYCLIPCKPGKSHDKKVIDGHIINRHRLHHIANSDGEVYHYHMDLMRFMHTAATEVKAKEEEAIKTKTDPKYIPIPPSRPKKIDIESCTEQFTCEYHDNEAFKLADKPGNDLDLCDTQTQFQLGLRSIVAHTALYYSYRKGNIIRQIKESKNHNKLVIMRTISRLKRLEISQNRVAKLAKIEFDLWIKAYTESDTSAIVSSVREICPALRIAGAGVKQRDGHSIAVTLLPQEQGKCTVIATAIGKPKLPVDTEANETANLLSQEKPAKIIETLVADSGWVFLYVSPDDYSQIPEDEQAKLEERIAENYQQWEKRLPDRHTGTTRSQQRRARRNRKSGKRSSETKGGIR